jgi:hypothetical protein
MRGLEELYLYYDEFELSHGCFDSDGGGGGGSGGTDDFGIGSFGEFGTDLGQTDQDVSAAGVGDPADDFGIGEAGEFGGSAGQPAGGTDVSDGVADDLASDGEDVVVRVSTQASRTNLQETGAITSDNLTRRGPVPGSGEDLLGRLGFGPANVRRPTLGAGA